MAEIIEQPPTESGAFSWWDTFIHIIANYWWILLLIAIIIGLLVAVFMIWRLKEENDRRRDNVVYATARNIWESCELNAKKEWIRNKYSLINLLWLGIPFKRNEHSVKIIDIDRNVIGFYRGHTKTQDGDHVFLAYKTKSFLGLKEDLFILYCPLTVQVPTTRLVNGRKVRVFDDKGKDVLTSVKMPSNVISFDKNAQEITIKCNTILKQGNYYKFPNYVILTPDGEQEHIDLTYYLSQFISKTNFVILAETTFGDMSRAIGKGIEINPYLKYDQKAPEKEKNIEEQPPE